jgi:hypothetical protein
VRVSASLTMEVMIGVVVALGVVIATGLVQLRAGLKRAVRSSSELQ